MKLKYEPHTPRLKIVDQYIRELFRDELPDGIKYHNADHTLHPTKGVVAVANNIAISENISEHDRELQVSSLRSQLECWNSGILESWVLG